MKYKLPFPNAPITEALIDLRVETSSPTSMETLASFHNRIKDRFPKKQERYSWKSEFKVKKDIPPEIVAPAGGPDGYFFKAPDERKLVQARIDGFTFNKLKPYEKWETFRNEAIELWDKYIQTVNPDFVTRLALRYINKIEIPLPMGDFKEYLLTVPEIAKGVPQAISTYFMRLEIPNPAIEAYSVITQTYKPVKEEAKTLPFIFDIDVFRVAKLKPNDRKIWKIMDELRDFKNSIFLNSITEKTMELFK